MRALGPIVLLPLLALPALGQHDDDTLRRTDQALFATYYPLHRLDAEHRATAAQVCSATSATFLRDPTARAGLVRFTDVGFADLSRAEREQTLAQLRGSQSNDLRRLARGMRSAYLLRIYSSRLGALILKPDPSPPVQERRVALPESKVTVVGGALVHKGGPIDVVVVGSGPGGSVLAHQLSAAGRRVVLLEAGPFVVPGAVRTRGNPRFMERFNRRRSSNGGVFVRNGRVVGGGSTVNIDLAFAPTTPSVRRCIDAWIAAGRVDAERFSAPTLAKAYAWVRRRMRTRKLSEEEINPNNRVLWDGAKAHGIQPRLYDLNRYATGKSPTPADDKVSAVRGLLLEALTRPKSPLTLIPDARVTRVRFTSDGTRVSGVEFVAQQPWVDHPAVQVDPAQLALLPKMVVRVDAKCVILAAGSLGSPAILLRSGLDAPPIGRGLVLHPSVPLVGEFDRVIDAHRGLTASVYVDHYTSQRGFFLESMEGDVPYVAVMVPGTGEQVHEVVSRYRNLAGFGVMLVDTPNDANRVRLDEQGRPEIDYVLGESDAQRLREGVAEAVRIMFKAGAKRVIVPTTENLLGTEGHRPHRGVFLTSIEQADLVEKNLAFVPNRTVLTSAHMQATLKMGPDPKTSAVGLDHRVWNPRTGKAFANLYVADSSVFPSSVGANPMQAIYSVARVLADRLLERP